MIRSGWLNSCGHDSRTCCNQFFKYKKTPVFGLTGIANYWLVDVWVEGFGRRIWEFYPISASTGSCSVLLDSTQYVSGNL